MKKVLIAVDDATTQELLGLIVGQIMQLKYDFAEDCFRAIDKIFNHNYSLIIISIRIHEDCWADVIETVNVLSPPTEIIVITNSECYEFKSSILKYGVSLILNKPFSVKQMQDAVAKIITD